jgi:protocatechuate 3,4-dioxygenase beta subunit
MSFSAHYLFAVLLTILSLPTSLWAQAASKEAGKTARGSISGRVTLKEKGVSGVAVALKKFDTWGSGERIPRAITDQDGFYRLTNVAPGSYEVSPSVPAFVPANARDARDAIDRRGKTVLVGEDENVENINFVLARGGVITGKVTDADGRPVIQQQVYIYLASDFEQRRGQQLSPQYFAVGSAPTDDRGIYRVFGLMPGRYNVAAGHGETTVSGSISPGRASYTQVFHPDATDQTKATVVEVGEGTEATNIDITLGRALQTFTVAGRVVDGEKSLPVANVRVAFRRQMGQRGQVVNTLATTNAQGDFVKEGLIPGKYSVLLFSNDNTGMLSEPLTFDIIDQDVSGITVKLAQGASLSGVVVVEPENPAAITRLPELLLRAYVATSGGGRSVGDSTAPVAANGSFSLTGLAGGHANVLITAKTGAAPPKGFTLARVERDGVVYSRGIPIKEGEQLTGLRVVVNYGTGIVHGIVEVQNGPLPGGAVVVVSVIRTGEQLPNVRPVSVDARGRFLIEGIPAGTYDVHAVTRVSPEEYRRTVKRDVTIQDGVTTEITLTIDMNPPKKP